MKQEKSRRDLKQTKQKSIIIHINSDESLKSTKSFLCILDKLKKGQHCFPVVPLLSSSTTLTQKVVVQRFADSRPKH